MRVLETIAFGFKYKNWCIRQFCFSLAAKLGICSNWFNQKAHYYFLVNFKKKYLQENGHSFNFKGAFLPNISASEAMLSCLSGVFQDTFLIPCCFNDNYQKKIIEYVDRNTKEGPYGYIDTEIGFDVSVSYNDIVIDAGAWIGDFSAYAASKGAIVYAFEPSQNLQKYLSETAILNIQTGKIIPIEKGLGDKDAMLPFSDDGETSVGASFCETSNSHSIPITSIDSFVLSNQLESVDFIKADIEGFERKMLLGAKHTLRKFAPKLAICTYHLPDDPLVLADIIKEANPEYTIIQMRHKLFACVIR